MMEVTGAKRVVQRVPDVHPGWTPRSEWGAGPWDDEPDLVEWRHAGLPCLVTRSGSGAWCGYVGVPGTHWAFGRHYDAVPENVSHGGLTFSGTCSGHICHVPAPSEPHTVWWLGFDCAHAGDFAPALAAHTKRYRLERPDIFGGCRDEYRSLGYVRAHVEALADDLQRPKRPVLLEDLVGAVKLFVRRDLPMMFKAIYLEQDSWGRGPSEREAIQYAYGGNRWHPNGLELVSEARAQDRPWERLRMPPWMKRREPA